MKYRVKKGTTVLTHTESGSFNMREFVPLETEIDVTFGIDDLWFKPGAAAAVAAARFVVMRGMNPKLDALDSLRRSVESDWFDYLMDNYYGFHLPNNKKEIDYIVVMKDRVEEVKSKDDVDSHISESDKALRKIRQQTGNHWMPGQGISK